MGPIKLILCLVLISHRKWAFISASPAAPATQSQSAYAQSSVIQSNDINTRDPSAAATLGSLYRRSRQSRCVRCYEDRYNDDRSRGGSSYYSRSADDRGNWYYPSERSSDRYDDRYRGGERDYDRYYYSYYGYNRDRDDRHAPRSSDRYEGRGYDRYDDRRGSYYDRGESRGYGYDNRDRYSDYNRGDRYNTDRYYDRARGSSGSGRYDSTDRDYYERYYPRYDFRNYRPWDETYRGQSGFDNSGRGYYFATSQGSNGRLGSENHYEPDRVLHPKRPLPGEYQYLPYDPQSSRLCGIQVLNCPYAGGTSSSESSPSSSATSQTGYSGNGQIGNGGTSTVNKANESIANKGQSAGSNGSWNYVNDRDPNNKGGDRGNRDRDRGQESSSYGGRRPLSGSYLLDRESNVISDGRTTAKAEVGNISDTNISKMAMERATPNTAETAALTSENQVQEGNKST